MSIADWMCWIANEIIWFMLCIRNYPLLMATWKVAPALAAGCTAILKPSELASVYVLINYCATLIIWYVGFLCCLIIYNFRTCLELAEICREVGLPPGVLNIVTGLGNEAGAPLSSHPDVDKVQPILLISRIKIIWRYISFYILQVLLLCYDF